VNIWFLHTFYYSTIFNYSYIFILFLITQNYFGYVKNGHNRAKALVVSRLTLSRKFQLSMFVHETDYALSNKALLILFTPMHTKAGETKRKDITFTTKVKLPTSRRNYKPLMQYGHGKSWCRGRICHRQILRQRGVAYWYTDGSGCPINIIKLKSTEPMPYFLNEIKPYEVVMTCSNLTSTSRGGQILRFT